MVLRKSMSYSAVAAVAALLPQVVYPADLVANGDFETDANGDGFPDGWGKGQGMSLREEAGNTWLVLDGSYASSAQTIALKPEWWQLKLTMRMRVTDVTVGSEGWKNARLAMSFHDDKGVRVGEWPNVFNAVGTSEWVDCDRVYDVPWGAATLRLNPANFGTKGKVEFDDIRIVVVRTRSTEKEDHPLPDGAADVWDMDKAWRQTSRTRERICINGLWRFIPVLPDGNETPPADGEGWGWFKVPGIWPGAGAQQVLLSSWLAGRHDLRKMDQAWYRRDITIPGNWRGRRVALDFGMVQTHARVFVDGKEAAEVWFPGGRADITQQVTPGKTHVLAILLTARPMEKESRVFMAPDRIIKSKASVKLKGLTGDVHLVSEPVRDAIADVYVITSTRRSTITFDTGLRSASGRRQLRARVLDGGKVVKTFESGLLDAAGRVSFGGKWTDAELWDTDTPGNVYGAVVSLLDENGTVLDESLPLRFGFRELWIEGRDFYLNGTRIHLRALHTRNINDFADKSCLEGCRTTCRRLREYGFNFFITANYNFSPGEVGYLDAMFQAADETGLLGSFSLPHVKDFNWKLDRPKHAQRYRELTEWLVRRVQNHPSIIAYAMNHNATGYYGDQNPLKIDGVYSPDRSSGKLVYKGNRFRSRNRQQAVMAADIAKSIDPTRPVYHHQSGNLGDMHTVNIYLNWAPRQERSDWLEHWATKGVKPLFFVEWGLPHVSSWSSYRGPQFIWRCLAYQRAWDSEFAAAHLGDRAYRMTPTKVASLRHEEDLWSRGKPFHWGHLIQHLRTQEENFLEIQSWFAEDNWRAHRTWGISAMLPWDQGGLWRRVKKTEARDVATRYADLQRPGIAPDALHSGSQYISDPGARDHFEPTCLGKTFLRWNKPLVGYIGGGPTRFTDKTDIFMPGETVRKQFVILNDTRRERTCAYTWEAQGASGRGQATVAPGEKALVPVSFRLQRTATLSAKFDFGRGVVQEDSLRLDVLPSAEPPRIGSEVALFDPKGLTAAMLDSLRVAYTRVEPDADLAKYGLLIVGREALSGGAALPGMTRVREGLKVLIFEQTPDVLTKRLGFRINVHGRRTAFARVPAHPALKGLTDDHLHDWRGAASLTPPYLSVDELETSDPKWLWCGFENTRVWRCRNHGNVASVLIEKPPRGNWLPIVDCGFDLQYAPLLEYAEGRGRIVFCQLDVTGRTEPDPAAQRICSNLLSYLDTARPQPTREVCYFGGQEGEKLLRRLGVRTAAQQKGALMVVGPGLDDCTQIKPTGPALCIGLGAKQVNGVTAQPTEAYSQFVEGLGRPEYAGVSNAELHWRTRLKHATIQGQALATIGNTVFCQAAPWMFDYVKQPYLRTTYRRNLFLVSRLLANLGATFETPLIERLNAPARTTAYPLPSDWRGEADREDVGRDKGWWRPQFEDGAWRPIDVPGTFDEQRAELADYNGLFWYRLRFRLPKDLTRKGLKLYVGPVDDESWIWLNGQFLGEVTKQTRPKDYWAFPREYEIKPGQLDWGGENVLAVRVNDTYKTGGLTGTPRLAGRSPWLDSYYVQEPEAADDPYRYYRW